MAHVLSSGGVLLPAEKAIVNKLRQDGPCRFEDVIMGLPKFTWREIFVAVECITERTVVPLPIRGLDVSNLTQPANPYISEPICLLG